MTDKYTEEMVGKLLNDMDICPIMSSPLKPLTILMNQAYEEGKKDSQILIFETWKNDNEGLMLTIKDLEKEKATLLHNVNHYSAKCIELEKQIEILDENYQWLQKEEKHQLNDGYMDACALIARLEKEGGEFKEENEKLKNSIKHEVAKHTENMVSWAQDRDALEKENERLKEEIEMLKSVIRAWTRV